MATTDDDDDPFDERGILKDGRKAHVSMQMRDAALVRRRGFDDSACHYQPGPLIVADRSAAAKAYQEMCDETVNAWRTAPPLLADAANDGRRRHRITSRDPQGRETGSAESEWEEEDSAPPPRPAAAPVRRIRTADEARQIRQAAYDQMVAESLDAWRTP